MKHENGEVNLHVAIAVLYFFVKGPKKKNHYLNPSLLIK